MKMPPILFLVMPLLGCNYFLSGRPSESIKGQSQPVVISEFADKNEQSDLTVNEIESLLAHGLTYEGVNKNTIIKYCLSCHSNKSSKAQKPFFDSYAQILAGKDLIMATLKSNKMPPRPGLSPIRKKLLLQWLETGAPVDNKENDYPSVTTEENSIFALVNKKIFQPKCIVCHGEGTDFDFRSKESLHKYAAQIREAVSSRKMPAGKNKLTESEIELVVKWANQAMNQKPVSTEANSPETTPELNFELVSQKVLQPRCVICHVAGGDYDFTTLESTRIHADAIKDAVISRRMPKGKTKLTEEQIDLVRQWVEQGAK